MHNIQTNQHYTDNPHNEVINDEQFEEIRELFAADFAPLVQTYISDSKIRVSKLREAQQSNDNANGFEYAHALKGASANLGATQLVSLSYQLQECCRDNLIAHQGVLIEQIALALQQVEHAINRHLGRIVISTPKISPSLPNVSTLPTLTINDYLSCLQIVMVNTTLPANIGAAARAMHTMGLSRLTVVDPKLPADDTSVSRAAGGSKILADATIAATLEAAIGNCQLVFAASSRSRHLPRPVVTPTQAAKIMLDFIDKQRAIGQVSNAKPDIAILFGREDRGLTNEELAYADYHIQIDANPDYPVLNVASAVQVIASFIYTYVQSHVSNHTTDTSVNSETYDTNHDTDDNSVSPLLQTYIRQQWDEPAITQQQLQQLIDRTTELMVARNLADSDHLRSLPSRLSRLGSRLQLDEKEYQLLSALVAKLLKG